MMMRRACTALALFSALSLSPRFAEAQGVGGTDGGYGTSYGVTPMDFLGQADDCPYMAMALYQQQMMYQQQSAQQTQLAGSSLGGPSRLNSTTGRPGSGRSSVALSNKKARKKRATNLASRSTAPKNIGSGSAATDASKGKTPQRTTNPGPSGAPTKQALGD
jgi:hypothetical protein